MQAEIQKLTEKFSAFKDGMENSFKSVEDEISSLKCFLESASVHSSLEGKTEIKKCIDAVRSKMTESVKSHRELHSSVSKLGKLIDKKSIEDFTTLATYFSDRASRQPDKLTDSDPSETVSVPFISEEGMLQRSSDELLHLVIVEHLFRQGHDRLATELVENFGFSVDEVKSYRFQELGLLMSAIYSGDLTYAKEWLLKHKDQLGSKLNQLEYTLAKLEFLYTMQRNPRDHSAVLERARQLSQYAHIYPADFEHLMGSLVFFGRSLKDTPYADLSVFAHGEHDKKEGEALEPMQTSPSSSQLDLTDTMGLLSTDDDMHILQSNQSNALNEASSLFKASCCAQLNLSELDPLYTVFTSGCRLLSRRHLLQTALSCASRFNSMSEDTLPVAIELDPIAHRHNIFHCPVLKEVTSSTNGPVRLNCGHAISKIAFENMLTVDRSKVKCPYCPLDSYKNQTLELIF